MLTNQQIHRLKSIRERCKKCNGEGMIPIQAGDFSNVQKCICTKKIALYYKFFDAGIPNKFIDCDLSDYLISTIPPKKFRVYLKDLPKWIDRGIGLYFYGNNGVGKSFLLVETIKEAIRQGYTAKFLSLEHFLKLTFQSLENSEVKRELEIINSADILAIDEIEKVYKPTKDNSFATIAFDDFFRSRSNNRQVICATANCEMHELIGIHGKHLTSLFQENLVPVEMVGGDFRKQLAVRLEREFLKYSEDL